jgi:hypothetical protein
MKDKKAIYGFLIEFIIMIFVFALVSTVSVTLFSKSKKLSDQAIAYNDGLLMVENIAEKMKSYNGESLDNFLSEYQIDEKDYNIEIEVKSVKNKYTLYLSQITYINKKTENVLIQLNISSIGSYDYE